jgi:glycosyltransferase involved in cell wall biosynthesis
MEDPPGPVPAAPQGIMTEPPLRVCLVAPLPPPLGGMGNWTRLVRRFAETRPGVELSIVDISPRWRAIDDLAGWKRILGGGLQLLRDYWRFWRILWRCPGVIHLTTPGQLAVVRDLAILITARVAGIATVYHLHFGRVPQIAANPTFEWRMLAWAIGLADVVIAIDPATAEAVQHHLPQTRTVRLPNGIDLAALPAEPVASQPPTVLFLGWVIPTKGVYELVEAWAQLKPKEWRCRIVGPGSPQCRDELQERFQPELLEFLPEQTHDEAMRLMAAASVFVLPSYTEGFPNVIIEAMAMGKAIIATDVGAMPEMLDGGCGVVVPARDTQALRDALARVLADPELRAAMGIRAMAKARQEYAMDRVFDQLEDLWRASIRRANDSAVSPSDPGD